MTGTTASHEYLSTAERILHITDGAFSEVYRDKGKLFVSLGKLKDCLTHGLAELGLVRRIMIRIGMK